MPEEDPTAPGWRPEYTGDDGLGDVGSGKLLGANCFDLYQAGRNELPGVARTYYELTTKVHRTADSMHAYFYVPGRGLDPAHTRLLELRDELHGVLRLTCLRMQQVGKALVEIATAYMVTDDAAVDEFTRLLDDVEDPDNDSVEARTWEPRPPVVPPPPAVNAPQPGETPSAGPPGRPAVPA